MVKSTSVNYSDEAVKKIQSINFIQRGRQRENKTTFIFRKYMQILMFKNCLVLIFMFVLSLKKCTVALCFKVR